MAIKTFTAGSVLTASDTNTYLANSGLVLITSGITVSSAGGSAATVSNGTVTVGAGNTSVTVSGAFSATYDNYRIIFSNGSQTITNAISLQLGTTNTNYYGFMPFGTFNSATVNGANDNATAFFTFAGGGDANTSAVLCDVINPFLSRRTEFSSRVRYGAVYGHYVGVQDTATSFTSFTLAPLSGSFNGGLIRVYGYRQV